MDNHQVWPVNAPEGVQLYGPDYDADVQMLVALGSVVRASSELESALRRLFCALEGSKDAAVKVAGENVEWIRKKCKSLLDRRDDITDQDRDQLKEILRDVRTVMDDRNRFVHDAWAAGPDGEMELLQSKRNDHNLIPSPVTLELLVSNSNMLRSCSIGVTRWISRALGGDAVGIESQLRWDDYIGSLSTEELAAMIRRQYGM